MTIAGDPRVVSDHGSALTWDGDYLPGPWLVRRAIGEARTRLAQHPMVTVVVGRSHHIACLQAFLKPAADAGLLIVLACSDPAARWVAPPGAVEPVYSPNPIAAGIPTDGDPILIDISASTTAAAVCVRAAKAGERLPGPWMVDRDGQATDDPRPLVEDKSGALYPLGGADLGYKGFALGVLLEAITSALAGHGRERTGSPLGMLGIPDAHRSGEVRRPRRIHPRDIMAGRRIARRCRRARAAAGSYARRPRSPPACGSARQWCGAASRDPAGARGMRPGAASRHSVLTSNLKG